MLTVSNSIVKFVTYSMCKWQKVQLMGNDNNCSFTLQQTEM